MRKTLPLILLGALAIAGCKQAEHKKTIEISPVHKIEYKYDKPLSECSSFSEFADSKNLKIIESYTDYQFANIHMTKEASWQDIKLYIKETGEKPIEKSDSGSFGW